MIQLFPTELLDWINQKDFNLDNYSNDSLIGCVLYVDLQYPDELHALHHDYLLVDEKIIVIEEMLSAYQLQIIKDKHFSPGKSKKLIPNLGEKEKYKLHYQNLKFKN